MHGNATLVEVVIRIMGNSSADSNVEYRAHALVIALISISFLFK
jgi:hypothetical protein